MPNSKYRGLFRVLAKQSTLSRNLSVIEEIQRLLTSLRKRQTGFLTKAEEFCYRASIRADQASRKAAEMKERVERREKQKPARKNV
jgi:hypothetical protein